MKLTFTILFLIYSNISYSFTLSNSVAAAFKQDDVKINVSTQSCDNIGITNDELLSMAVEGAQLYWNTIATSRLELVPGSLINTTANFKTDNICSSYTNNNCNPNPSLKVDNDITIACNQNAGTTNADNFQTNGVLAVTVPNHISGDRIHGSLILINDRAGTSFAALSRESKVATLAHEIGHAVGLGHSPVKYALMYYTEYGVRNKLSWDDVDGITFLYPSEQPVSFGCGTIDTSDQEGTKNGLILMTLLIALMFKVLKSNIRIESDKKGTEL